MTLPPRRAASSEFAVALLDSFIALGVREIVLCPGSRSQALALAAVEFERAGRVKVRVRIDERVAGFLALGLAVESTTPVIVITTSGTAVANLHPAVLEAHHSAVPIIVISADRPEDLRGIGANQTTDQSGIFGTAVRRSWDVGAPTGEPGETDAAARLARDAMSAALGPVHLNIAFSEPLSGETVLPAARAASVEPVTPATPHAAATPLVVTPAIGTVVIAGTSAGPAAEQLAHDLGAPLFAEVASGAHFGRNLVVAYRELLGDPEFAAQIDRVIVLGHPTLSREVPALIKRGNVESIVVRTPGVIDYNPGRTVSRFVDAIAVGPALPDAEANTDSDAAAALRAFTGRWVLASRALLDDPAETGFDPAGARLADPGSRSAFTRSELARVREPLTRRSLVEAVWAATWPHDRLVLGASRLIREADRVVPGKKIHPHANRGLAGIDGTISTAIGIALASQVPAPHGPGASGVTRALIGDLTALHDVGGLLFGEGEEHPRIQVIIGNDGGGTIFDALEVSRSAPTDAFDRALFTPQRVSFDGLAAAYGWEYLQVSTRGDLEQALTASVRPTIIEVALSR